MSKNSKPQNQNQDQVTQELEAQKRELMQAGSSLKMMKDRMDRMELEKEQFQEENADIKKKLYGEKEGLVDLIEFHKKEKEELREEKQRIEFEYNILKRKMDDIDEHHNKLLELKQKDFDMERISLVDKIKQLEARLEKIDSFLQVKADLENERRQLIESLEKEKKEKQRELADKDREKNLETDKLKKDMLHKIQDTKQSLLALKKEQLETTTRLTVLQNHQLTTELEYQSKQTEKLLFKNSKLSEQVTSLKRDIEIHKQVEQELAKRSHFSQKLIKKLSARIKELEDEQELRASEAQENFPNKEDLENEDRFKEMDLKILQLERKISKLQNDNDILRNENNHLQTKLDTIRLEDNKFNNLSLILANNLEQIKQSSSLEEYKDVVDLQELREKQVNDWSNNQKQAVLTLLLTQAQQFITKKNLNTTDNPNITVLDNNVTNTNFNNATTNANKSVNLPKINQQDEESNQGSKRFQGVPLDISTQIVKSNLRDWGKPSASQPSSQLARKFKVK